MSSTSCSFSSGMTLAVSETFVLCSGVFASVEIPEDSAPSRSLRRLTTRFFRFRMGPARPRPAPRLKPADDEYCDTSEGRDTWVSFPVLSEATEEVFDLTLANVDCILDRLECVKPGVLAPDSGRSWFVHARKTTSLIPGVNSDKVRCDSDKAARRRMFFCENEAWISDAGSSDKASICAESRGFPKASTAS